ncbi:metal ABC transporter ATP-binding protein [Tessaracoccus terricola]
MAVPENQLLSAEGIYVSLGGLPILRDVSLHVDRGEAVAVLGGNGSGKSTLIRAVVGLNPLQEGTVRLFGQPLHGFKQWSRVGYVPQHSSLNVSNATVQEIVTSGRLAHRKPFHWFRRADRVAVAGALELVGLADRAKWPFRSLSGGQKQRTLIARALSTEPELLVMDEPFAGVDLHSQAGLANLLAGLRADGLGIAVVLHELGPMATVLDRSITLCDGRLVDHEPPGTTFECDPAETHDSGIGLLDPVARGN